MNEEEKFDELLSSKLSERDFPFDELNWDEAERLIIRQQRRRRIIGFATIFAVGLAAGVLIMLPFVTSTHNASSHVVVTASTANQNHIAQNSVLPAINQSQVNANNTTGKEEKAPLPVHSAFVKKDTRTGIRSNPTNISPVAKTHQKQQPVIIADENKNDRNPPAEPGLLASAGEINKTPEHAETATQETPNPTSSQPATNTIVENKAPANISDKTEKSNTGNGSVANNSSTVVNTDKVVSNSSGNKETAKKDSNNVIAPPPLLRDAASRQVHDNNYPSNIFSVYAGGNYSFGWSDNRDKEASGITPWGGFNFTHYFGSMSASLGVGYSELTSLNKTYTSSVIGYDFGANATVTTVTPQTVYYIAFPLKLQYNLDENDIVGIGCNYLLMLTTYSTLTTYRQNYFSETPASSEKQNGYTQGFNNSDMQLVLLYTRMLTGRLGISFEYYHDFDYIENNSIPGINQYAKNNGIRLVLSYQLMK